MGRGDWGAAMIRALILGFGVLTVIYVVVSVYSRSVRREKLEKGWDTDPANEGRSGTDRSDYLTTGMKAYHSSLRRRLILLVYVVPLVLIAATVYFVDVQ